MFSSGFHLGMVPSTSSGRSASMFSLIPLLASYDFQSSAALPPILVSSIVLSTLDAPNASLPSGAFTVVPHESSFPPLPKLRLLLLVRVSRTHSAPYFLIMSCMRSYASSVFCASSKFESSSFRKRLSVAPLPASVAFSAIPLAKRRVTSPASLVNGMCIPMSFSGTNVSISPGTTSYALSGKIFAISLTFAFCSLRLSIIPDPAAALSSISAGIFSASWLHSSFSSRVRASV